MKYLMAVLVSLTCFVHAEGGVHVDEGAHTDLFLSTNMDQSGIEIGVYDFDTEDLVPDINVFSYSITGPFDSEYTTNSPGYIASSDPPEGYGRLASGVDLYFTIEPIEIEGVSSNLLHWDGNGAVNFMPVSDGSYLSMNRFGFIEVIADGSDTRKDSQYDAVVFGSPALMEIDITGSNGQVHSHIDYDIKNDIDTPMSGIYAMSLTLYYEDEMENEVASAPIVMMFHTSGVGSDDELAAVDYFDELLNGSAGPAGDLNDDMVIDGLDINLMFGAVNSGLSDGVYDLNDDMVVDAGDVDYLIESILGTAYGDATLDRVVNLEDLARLATFFGQSEQGWAEGDFSGDGVVDLVDLARLATNFGMDLSGNAEPAAVVGGGAVLAIPEPGTGLIGLMLVGLFGGRRC